MQVNIGDKVYNIAFPFDAVVELMGDVNFTDYFTSYNSLSHQLKVFEVGIRYGQLQAGVIEKQTPSFYKHLAQGNLGAVRKVWAAYDAELIKFLEIYLGNSEDAPEGEVPPALGL
jgi:hypothetical protein